MNRRPLIIVILVAVAFIAAWSLYGLYQSSGDIRVEPANPSGQSAQ